MIDTEYIDYEGMSKFIDNAISIVYEDIETLDDYGTSFEDIETVLQLFESDYEKVNLLATILCANTDEVGVKESFIVDFLILRDISKRMQSLKERIKELEEDTLYRLM